jgi:hypothetical protein
MNKNRAPNLTYKNKIILSTNIQCKKICEVEIID